ncbi:MAG TPA: hypothetical protein VGZ48_10525 [Candidatus Acidoferrales bacterium]|nr:hypothetical protein [Candidatus Acidoferrales bacterium]
MKITAKPHQPVKRVAISRKEIIGGVAAVVLIGAVGLALALQGWKSRIPDAQDWVFDITSARALVAHGRIPDRGTVTSYLSFAPPGTAWLFVPGVMLFRDPRLAYLPAGGLLYLGTLAGIFFLSRRYLGQNIAVLAIVAYGLSMPALELANYPGPRAHPFFYVWMVYCICRWVEARDARYLAAALLIWAMGMFVFLGLAPAIFVSPVVWLLWRPPLRVRPLALAAFLALLLWYPYLRLEAGRRFADVRSQILLQPLTDSWGDQKAWCDPNLIPPSRLADQETPIGLRETFSTRVEAIVFGLVSNFQGAFPGTTLILLFGTLVGLWLCLGAWLPPPSLRSNSAWNLLFAILFAGVVAQRFQQSSRTIALLRRALPSDLTWLRSPLTQNALVIVGWAILAGAVFLARRRLGTILSAVATRFHPTGDPRPLAIALLVPWLILLVIAEPGRVTRFLWFEALQLVFFAASIVTAAESSRFLRWAGPAAVILLVACNPMVMGSVEAWGHAGWSGEDAPAVQAANYLADRVHSAGEDAAWIGYPLPLIDGRLLYRSVSLSGGANIDLLLNWRGITNANPCAEGQSLNDEYRVLDTSMPGPYLEVPSSGRFQFMRQFGYLEVYQRE